jgi:hypothetical protein
MSDTVVKLIPLDPGHVPGADRRSAALALFVELTGGWEPEERVHATLQYVDAGENEEGATCPNCRRRLVFDWSSEHQSEMDWYREVVHLTERSADGHKTRMPCCGAELAFSEVEFESSGFAKCELLVSNPDVDYPLPTEMLARLEDALGCQLRQIWARY